MMDTITDWLSSAGLTILAIVVVAWLADRFMYSAVTTVVRKAIDRDHYASEREEKLREDTIISLVAAVLRIALYGAGVLIILSEFGLNIGPLLAGAGVIGLAVGFGAQSLIKDFVSGLFIVLENQYRVGDVVELNGVSGTVQKLTARLTVIRDLDGNAHYISNGTIDKASNMTMEYARINLDVGVGYSSDLNKVKDVVNKVGLEMAKDEDWKDFITEAPYFARVDELGDSAIVIKIFGKTLPAKQWGIEGELRKRLKEAFDKSGIEIPFPQLTVHKPKN